MTRRVKTVDITFLHTNAGVEICFFCFACHFLLLTQIAFSSPIATKGFGSAVSPLFCTAFA